MIIAGTWPPDPAEIARQLREMRERMARLDESGRAEVGPRAEGPGIPEARRSTGHPLVDDDAGPN
jgi:hypothetical protein